MKKLTEKELHRIKENQSECVTQLSNGLLQIDYEIKLRKEELLSLPTKDDRIRRIKEITKMVLANKE